MTTPTCDLHSHLGVNTTPKWGVVRGTPTTSSREGSVSERLGGSQNSHSSNEDPSGVSMEADWGMWTSGSNKVHPPTPVVVVSEEATYTV